MRVDPAGIYQPPGPQRQVHLNRGQLVVLLLLDPQVQSVTGTDAM